MGYLCAEVVLSLSSGREIVFRGGSVSDDQPRYAARARDGEAIVEPSDAGARPGGSASAAPS